MIDLGFDPGGVTIVAATLLICGIGTSALSQGTLAVETADHQQTTLTRKAAASSEAGPVAVYLTSTTLANGEVQLPNQWSLKPAGKSVPLGDFPASMSVSRDHRWGAVLHCGWGQHEVRIVDLKNENVVSSAPLRNAWVGTAWTPAEDVLYVSGGVDDVLIRFPVHNGHLGRGTTITLPISSDSYNKKVGPLAAQMAADHERALRGNKPRYPAGIALSKDGKYAYIAETYADRVVRAQLPSTAHGNDSPTSLIAPTRVLKQFETGADPYRTLFDAAHSLLYVSLWGSSSVAAIDLTTTGELYRIPTGPHPNELALTPDGSRLFVACANTNYVDVIDTTMHKRMERLSVSLYPGVPAGSTPNALALSGDGKTLLVANADNNDLVAFDVSDRDRSIPKGFIPTGWYPSAVGFGPSNRIVAINGKGNSSMENPEGPRPGVRGNDAKEYIGGLLHGSAEFIDFPDETQMKAYSKTVHECSPLRSDLAPVGAQDADVTNPVPRKRGAASPIKYCVYIIKENRTYDQVLGDMPEGNGDPSLCLFGENITPNHHALARQFVLLDNFYCDAEVSPDGHEWSTGAYATDYVERTWPPTYGHRGGLPYPAEGLDANGPAEAGHLWDRARAAGITYRSYGEWVAGGATTDAKGLAPALVGHVDPHYPEFNMDIKDAVKAAEFLHEVHDFETTGDLPRLTIIRLPNDHTVGTRKGSRTPRAYLAEHDEALGSIIDALSRTRFWKEMTVFIVEDDAQNGSDHVDAHRTVAMLAGPFVKHGYVDHTLYSTTSMLRTMELILNLAPMSQFDAAARPMYNSFSAKADLAPYDKRAARFDTNQMNGPHAPLSKVSAMLDFSHEDANPDVEFNEIIWKSVKGVDSEMPPPVRAAFVRPTSVEKDND